MWSRDESVVVELFCGGSDSARVIGSSDNGGDAMSDGTRDIVDMPRMLAIETSCEGFLELLMDVLQTDRHLVMLLLNNISNDVLCYG